MSQISNENYDNSFVAASDFVQLDQPDEDEVPDQEARQLQLHPQFGLQLKAEIRALKENEKANYQSLEAKFAKMLSTQNAQHQKEMEQLKDEFAKMLDEQQTRMMAQFDSLGQKLRETEQRAQIKKNELEEAIHENQQKLEKFLKEMNKNGNQTIGSNLKKLDCMWNHLNKIVANPNGIVWSGLNKKARTRVSECGLKATSDEYGQWLYATKGFAISGEHCRKENFPFSGTFVFYFEVIVSGCYGTVSLSDGNAGHCTSTNSYAIERNGSNGYDYWLSGKEHKFDRQYVATEGDVVGCGLLLNSKNKLAFFFTLNGILLARQTPINPRVDRLYPTAFIYAGDLVEANFGDNLVAKPFKFDMDKCPELVFE